MAWKSDVPLADGFVAGDRAIRQAATAASAFSAGLTSDVNADYILRIHRDARAQDAVLAQVQSIPGIAQYARDQFDDATFDVAAEFLAARNAIQAVATQIETDLPVNGGFLQTHSFAGGAYTPRTFTPAQTASLKATLDTVAALVS